MKRIISAILVMLFMFITPVSNVNTYACKNCDNHSSGAIEGPLVFALKIILYPLAAAGGTYVVCQGIDKVFKLQDDDRAEVVALEGVKKIYVVAKNGVNFGLNKLNEVFTRNNLAQPSDVRDA